MWGDDQPSGPGLPAVLAGLGGGEVTAHPGALRSWQRGLDEQQIRPAGELAERSVGRGVRAEGEAATGRLGMDLHGVGGGEVGNLPEARPQWAQAQGLAGPVLAQDERLFDQGLGAPCAAQPPQGVAAAGR